MKAERGTQCYALALAVVGHRLASMVSEAFSNPTDSVILRATQENHCSQRPEVIPKDSHEGTHPVPPPHPLLTAAAPRPAPPML